MDLMLTEKNYKKNKEKERLLMNISDEKNGLFLDRKIALMSIVKISSLS